MSASGDRRLRVGFDGRALSSPAGGVRRYTRELLTALAALNEPVDLVMLGGLSSTAPVQMEHVAEPPHLPTNLGWTLMGLPQAMRRGRVDVLHAPSYTAPFWAPAPVVLTVHDVSYARHPEWFPYRRDALRRAFYRWSALSAVVVATDSEFSASEIQAAYGISRDRIAVVPLGVDASFTAPAPHDSGALPSSVPTPFVLHVGDLHERRNLPMLVEAVVQVRRRAQELSRLALVLAGIDRGVASDVKAVAARAGAADAVVVLGAVPEDTLRALYARAAALVYASFYEGFGLPVLEAMASGTPVIASRAASIPEVLGDVGLLLDPTDQVAWVEAIVHVLSDQRVADDMRQKGRARAASFTWERTARATLQLYRRAAHR